MRPRLRSVRRRVRQARRRPASLWRLLDPLRGSGERRPEVFCRQVHHWLQFRIRQLRGNLRRPRVRSCPLRRLRGGVPYRRELRGRCLQAFVPFSQHGVRPCVRRHHCRHVQLWRLRRLVPGPQRRDSKVCQRRVRTGLQPGPHTVRQRLREHRSGHEPLRGLSDQVHGKKAHVYGWHLHRGGLRAEAFGPLLSRPPAGSYGRVPAMKNIVAFGFVAGGCLLGGCGKEEPPPATAAQQQQYPQQQYPQQQQQYPQQQQPQQYPQAAPAATTPAGAAAPAGAVGGQMATPGPLALPCQNDGACGFARCNVQFQKCAFPCQGPVDCAQGNSCNTMTGLCLPGAH
jgi:hypothetical protein